MNRRQFIGVGLGASAATLADCAASPRFDSSPSPVPTARAQGTWRPISTAGGPTYQYETVAFWTGREMLVWSGSAGALYDPAGDRWRTMTAQGAPMPTVWPLSATWTGRELLVWDGFAAAGARYDSTTDRWTPMARRDAPSPRGGAKLVWTGAEAILFGGSQLGQARLPSPAPRAFGGGRYDPSTDSWRPIADSSLPHPGFVVVWTGHETLAWGGAAKTSEVLPGAAYDPAADSWRRVPTAREPSPRTNHAAVWTGDLLIVVGGFGNQVSGQPIPPLDGAAYEPSTNRWLPLSPNGAPSGRARHTAVWTGREVLVWGGEQGSWANAARTLVDGAAYDPASDSWRPLPTDGAPRPRQGHVAVWTGNEMLVWSGASTIPAAYPGMASTALPAEGAALRLA